MNDNEKPVEKADVKEMLAYKIDYDRNGNEKSRKVLQTVKNFEIIMDHDVRFAGKIKFNEFSYTVDLIGAVPWDTENICREWSDYDDSILFSILQTDYAMNNRMDYFDAIKIVSMRNKYHPVKNILDNLEYKGKGHIGRLLPDYLGAEDTLYTHEVMRLWMLGAVARIYDAGCKFDYTPILTGDQGLGKSTFLQLLALNDKWFSDSLNGLDNDGAAQALTGTWIVELSELKALARTVGGVDAVKAFLTARQDKYRLPYARRTSLFLRQNVFIGTTNQKEFLQDETGNRRFLVIKVGLNKPKKDMFNSEMVRKDIEAAWAEAIFIYKKECPVLVLPKELQDEAKQLQAESTSDDGKAGIIADYLQDKQRTCIMQIWQEALREVGRPQKWQSSEISNIILSLPDWERMKSNGRFKDYGLQKGFQKVSTNCKPMVYIVTKSDENQLQNKDIKDDFVKVDQMELPFGK